MESSGLDMSSGILVCVVRPSLTDPQGMNSPQKEVGPSFHTLYTQCLHVSSAPLGYCLHQEVATLPQRCLVTEPIACRISASVPWMCLHNEARKQLVFCFLFCPHVILLWYSLSNNPYLLLIRACVSLMRIGWGTTHKHCEGKCSLSLMGFEWKVFYRGLRVSFSWDCSRFLRLCHPCLKVSVRWFLIHGLLELPSTSAEGKDPRW